MFIKQRMAAVFSLLLVLGLGGCDWQTSIQESAVPVVGVPALSSHSNGLTPIEGRIPATILDLSASRLIGVDGGSISLAGHSIHVPAGAVAEPTVFTLALLTNGLVEVDITKAVVDLFGTTTDVGVKRFAKGKTVALKLTYAWATKVQDPSRLVIAHRQENGELVALPSVVDPNTRTVTAQLEHFSRYCIATN